ncbi:MAG: hypothetical protein K0S34_231 [Bacillales bacterium]|jgi:hypothetical protein|nr:hypothetical protein [Bacillales bacterium]
MNANVKINSDVNNEIEIIICNLIEAFEGILISLIKWFCVPYILYLSISFYVRLIF